VSIPVRFHFQNLERSPSVEAYVRRWVQRLDAFEDRVLGIRVCIEGDRQRRLVRRGRRSRVSLDLLTRDGEIAIGRGPGAVHEHADLTVAIGDAFRDAWRVLVHDARRRHDTGPIA
jgi:hypothetical protein